MAGQFSITKKESVKELLSQMYYAYYGEKKNLSFAQFAGVGSGANESVVELPVLSDGITLKTAEPDETKVKVIDGTTWDITAQSGDDDMSFQIPSVHSAIANIFGDPVAAAVVGSAEAGVTFDGTAFVGQGYSTSPKRVEGALFCVDATKEIGVYFPNVAGYSTLTLGEEGKPAYFTYSFSAFGDASGASYYILKKKAS